MRSQASTSSRQNETSQKKSVFDRLGRQLAADGRPMKRRPSPGQYGDHGPPPPLGHPMHDGGDYGGRYGGRMDARGEMEWRYQNDRRMMPPFSGRDRHLPPPQPLPPSPMQQQAHYEMEMGNRQPPPPYFPHPNSYHAGPQGGMPPPMPPPPGGMPISMHQQRSSPKYDRMGLNFKNHRGRMNPMDPPGISPPRNFMPTGPAPPPPHSLGLHDMGPPPTNMTPDGPPMFNPSSYRWGDNMDPDYMMNHHGNQRIMDEQLFERRFNKQQHQTMQHIQQSNPQSHNHNPNEGPRYTRWRERRDVITNLDRETARSSSRTDSLKSTLQHSDTRASVSNKSKKLNSDGSRSVSKKDSEQSATKHKSSTDQVAGQATSSGDSEKDASIKEANSKKESSQSGEQQDISDGEIIDDEDSSDDEEPSHAKGDSASKGQQTIGARNNGNYPATNRNRTRDIYGESQQQHYYENGKKLRLLIEREDYAMDYETISDDDLDDFMEDKKISDEEARGRIGDRDSKSSSEIELLNALGLDWANLVEIAKQSKASNKETSSPSPQFSLSNYLPTLGITAELAGPELYELVMKTCRTSHDHYQ